MKQPSDAKRARDRAVQLAPKPTEAQIKYLSILLNDCGFTTRILCNDYLSRKTKRKIKYLDELTLQECSTVIGELKARRDDRGPYYEGNDRHDEEDRDNEFDY